MSEKPFDPMLNIVAFDFGTQNAHSLLSIFLRHQVGRVDSFSGPFEVEGVNHERAFR